MKSSKNPPEVIYFRDCLSTAAPRADHEPSTQPWIKLEDRPTKRGLVSSLSASRMLSTSADKINGIVTYTLVTTQCSNQGRRVQLVDSIVMETDMFSSLVTLGVSECTANG